MTSPIVSDRVNRCHDDRAKLALSTPDERRQMDEGPKGYPRFLLDVADRIPAAGTIISARITATGAIAFAIVRTVAATVGGFADWLTGAIGFSCKCLGYRRRRSWRSCRLRDARAKDNRHAPTLHGHQTAPSANRPLSRKHRLPAPAPRSSGLRNWL